MKTLNHIRIKAAWIMLILPAVVFTACEKDESGSKIRIDGVFLHNETTTTTPITQVRPGTIIRIEGAGFITARAVYVNGLRASVNPNYVTENSIIMQLPSSLPYGSEVDESVRNTIRIVSDYDDYSYPFDILGPPPAITGVSHSLPKPGDRIEIYGSDLRDLETVVFPGGVALAAGQFEVNSSYSLITCTIPEGAASTPGAIYVEGANGGGYSHQYMNHGQIIFLKNFYGDPNVNGVTPYNWGFGISGNQDATLPESGDGPKNPAIYRQVPAEITDFGVDANPVGFHFRPEIGMQVAINTADGAITTDMNCSNLALQFDYYIPVEWESGFIRVDLISGNNEWRVDYAPWVTRGPVRMTGWQTATIPLGSFSGLNGTSVSYFIQQTEGADGVFSFINSAYTDASGNSIPASPIEGFRLSFGHLRIVPYVRPQVETE